MDNERVRLGEGEFGDRLWLRCYDHQGNWILTPEKQEKLRSDLAELELAQLKAFLQQSGVQYPQS